MQTAWTHTQVKRVISAGIPKTVVIEKGVRGGGSLVLRVRGADDAAWFLRWHENGRQLAVVLGAAAGQVPTSLKTARDKYRKYSALVLDGEDPREVLAREQARDVAAAKAEAAKGTVEALFRAYIAHLHGLGKETRSLESALLSGKFAAVRELGRDIKAKDVVPADIQRVLANTLERGRRSMAAHLRAYLFGAFAFGQEREYDYTRPAQDVQFSLTLNPVAVVPRDKAAFRVGQRFLSAEEIKLLWFAPLPWPSAPTPTWQLCCRLILATGGQRVREVLEARQEEFDLSARVWSLPSARTKNGRAHPLPLLPRAVAIIEEALAIAKGSPYLFPGGEGRTDLPATDAAVCRAVAMLCSRSGIPPWTPRDLRRTVRTHLSEAGIPGHRLDVLLNHGLGGVGEKHYDRAEHLGEKLKVLLTWDHLLAGILGETEGGKVLPFPGRASGSE